MIKLYYINTYDYLVKYECFIFYLAYYFFSAEQKNHKFFSLGNLMNWFLAFFDMNKYVL